MDPLEEYNSEEDEDYVPDDEKDEYVHESAGRFVAAGKGTKRKRGGGAVQLSAPERVPLNARQTKKKGPARIGAAVLSDDDEELMRLPEPEQTEQESREASAEQPVDAAAHEKSRDSERQPAEASIATATAQADAPHTGGSPPDPADERTHTPTATSPSPSTTTPAAASSSTHSVSAPQAFQSPAPTSSASSAAASKGGDLASILAQFNKKSTKPVQKRVINSWELPAKPKPAATPTTPSATAATPYSLSPPPPPPTAALSTEQVVVSDITSYAGETLQVTKTLIRGSAEELAHRAAASNNLTALLSSLTSARAISTLEKSRLDWTVDKQEEGDADELKRFVGSKEGLVDRMAFLARTETREWEKVKAARGEGKKQTMVASTEGMDGD
ncbi:hypothetical protein MMC34_008634 [Xylographa carneopallida]|nr:hypothetical protein [Xylographa carneopallida]